MPGHVPQREVLQVGGFRSVLSDRLLDAPILPPKSKGDPAGCNVHGGSTVRSGGPSQRIDEPDLGILPASSALLIPAVVRPMGHYVNQVVDALSNAGLRRSEAADLTWGDVQRWDDGSGRITVVRSKTDVEAAGAVVAITPTAMKALYAIRPAGAGGEVKVFGLSESQIARRVKVIAKAAGLADWEFFSGHSGRVGMARRMAQNGAPTHEIERQGRWKQGGGMVGRYTRGESAGSALRYL